MAQRVRVLAPAKVNLTLEVLGRRADGYHDLASVIATADLRDDVRVARSRRLDVRVRPDVGAPPDDELAARAVRALAAATARPPHVHVVVRKRIPVAAGLGGGSSDAGAVLRALAALWRVSGIDLAAVGATIGSDVPFFAAGCAFAQVGGRGEAVTPLPPGAPLWITLVLLPARAATADVFRSWEGERHTDGRATEEVAGLARKGSLSGAAIRELALNDLAASAERVCPLVREAREAAAARGIALVVSGSGPSLFAAADDRAHALRMSRSLRRIGLAARARAIGVTADVVA